MYKTAIAAFGVAIALCVGVGVFSTTANAQEATTDESYSASTAADATTAATTISVGTKTRYFNVGTVLRNGDARLVVQGDGNVVIYKGSRATWSTRTNGMCGSSTRLAATSSGMAVQCKNSRGQYHTIRFGVYAHMTPRGCLPWLQGANTLTLHREGVLRQVWTNKRGAAQWNSTMGGLKACSDVLPLS